jgi:hypothetical protein
MAEASGTMSATEETPEETLKVMEESATEETPEETLTMKEKIIKVSYTVSISKPCQHQNRVNGTSPTLMLGSILLNHIFSVFGHLLQWTLHDWGRLRLSLAALL